jgi:hypothetical protein
MLTPSEIHIIDKDAWELMFYNRYGIPLSECETDVDLVMMSHLNGKRENVQLDWYKSVMAVDF